MKAATMRRAARLYALSMVAHTDCGGAATAEQMDVIDCANQKARAELARLGHDYGALGSLQDCIDAAMRDSEKRGTAVRGQSIQ
jgi:hypothetical protein